MKSDIDILLTPEERGMAAALGAMAVSASAGIPKAAAVRILEKVAWEVPTLGGAVNVAGNLAAALALLVGVPTGYMAHAVHNRISGETPEERERLARIRYYRDVTRQIENKLPASTT